MNGALRSRWSFAWILAVTALGACGNSSTVMDAGGCFPACRVGTVCAPSGVCVDACNPPCTGGQVCVGSGAAAMCVAPGTDAGTPATDTPSSTDVPVGVDVGAPANDVPAAVDAPTSDVPVTATDAGAPDDATPTNCGHPGEACCVMRACYGGAACANNVCVAPFARQTGECSSPSDCAAPQVCTGRFTCAAGVDAGVADAGNAAYRVCWLCGTSTGTAAFGAACTTTTDCVTGVCTDGSCTVPCAPGDAGDAQCQAHGANYRCFALYSQEGGTGAPITTLGVCSPTCARDSDCTGGRACVPRLNYFTNRMEFACATTTRTGTIGAACNPSGTATCRNVLCVGTTSATMGYCTAPCTSDADCPAAAPACGSIFFTRPDGHDQPGRACAPR